MADFIDKSAPSEFRTVIRYQEGAILSMITGTIKDWVNEILEILNS
jgi:hypothetical protein